MLLMITDGKKWDYLVVTYLSALFKGKLSNHHEDFYCLKCFNSYTTKNKLKEHEKICSNHDSCHIEMPKCFEKILKYNPAEKSLKVPFAIYLDLECLLEKNNLVKIITIIKIIKITIITLIISKNRTQRKTLGMSLQARQCLQDVHLIKKKVNLIITEEKIINYKEKK